MMHKVTIKFSFFCGIILFFGCTGYDKQPSEFDIQHVKDSSSEAKIDSANAAIKMECDTLMVYQVPEMVDSLLKDTALLQHFFDSGKLYSDEDKKAEKIIRQLQADCDSNLLRETYRIAQQRQKLKPKQRPKPKA